MTEPGPVEAHALSLHLLVLRCQAGDERAFARLMDLFATKTLGYLWSITFFFVAILAILVCMQVAQLARGALVGALPWVTVFGAAMPLVIILGLLSVLVATLSTIGIFLRLRTASLMEIQLRLAALEDMLAARGNAGTAR